MEAGGHLSVQVSTLNVNDLVIASVSHPDFIKQAGFGNIRADKRLINTTSPVLIITISSNKPGSETLGLTSVSSIQHRQC